MGESRITAFSFFSSRRGLDNKLEFSVNSIVKWSERTPTRTKGKLNDRIRESVRKLIEKGYLFVEGRIGNLSYVEAEFNMDKISSENERFQYAIVYLDEIKSIFDYHSKDSGYSKLSVDVILLVFAYLRMWIFKRSNAFKPEEESYDVNMRRKTSPDARSGYYCDIADDLGLPRRTVSKVVKVLNDIGLIYSESLPRCKLEGKWRTDHTIFCNVEKRERGYLLDGGEEYYTREVNNRKKLMKK